MYEIICYDYKHGKMTVSEINNEPINDQNLDRMLFDMNCNLGLDIIEVRKNGKLLTEEEIEKIRTKYPKS